MKSKWFVVLCVLALTSLVLSACGAPAAESNMVTEVGEGEGEVSIISWAGYIERGETDPAYDWVTAFEEATACKESGTGRRFRTALCILKNPLAAR